jgi:hypothetical protein
VIGLLLVLQLALPNVALTPGAARPLTTAEVCATKWGLDRRFVTERMKRHVFAAYGIDLADRGLYEVDHLVPRELGGADDLLNLWPQPWVGPQNARVKDREENRLHRAVCAGTLTLAAAQRAMRQWAR